MNGEYKGRVFKESFRGFNKEDVTNFIDSISRTYNTNLMKLEGEVEKLRKELEQTGGETGSLVAENETNKKIINELNEKIKMQNEKISSQSVQNAENQEEYKKIGEENTILKIKLDELENLLNEELNKAPASKNQNADNDLHIACRNEIEILRNENKNLKEQNAGYNADIGRLNISLNEFIRNNENNVITVNVDGDINDEKKKAVYDTVMTNLGKIIFSTEKEAAEILRVAKEKAVIIVSQAENNAVNTLAAAKDECDRIGLQNKQILSKIRERNQKLIIEYSVIRDNTAKDLESLIKNITNAEHYLTELENALEK